MTTRCSIIFLLLTLGLGCQSIKSKETHVIEGDLYFSYFRYSNFYNQPDSIINKVIALADTADRTLLDSADLSFLKIYDTLKKEKFLHNPYVALRLDTDSIITLLLSQDDYLKIAPTNYQNLIDTKKKVRIKADARQIAGIISYCNKLIFVDTLDGETLPKSKKLKIDDYR
jgi:hypothetical protein